MFACLLAACGGAQRSQMASPNPTTVFGAGPSMQVSACEKAPPLAWTADVTIDLDALGKLLNVTSPSAPNRLRGPYPVRVRVGQTLLVEARDSCAAGYVLAPLTAGSGMALQQLELRNLPSIDAPLIGTGEIAALYKAAVPGETMLDADWRPAGGCDDAVASPGQGAPVVSRVSCGTSRGILIQVTVER